jgi:hypothetical protein
MSRGNSVAGGTLVLMVPTSAGLVIAADSRMTHQGDGIQVYCDNYYKITEIARFDRAAFVVTGNSTVWDLSKTITLDDVCREARVIFDASVVVKDAFENGEASPSNIFEPLPQLCVAVMQKFIAINKVFDVRRGKQLFQVAVGSYDDTISRVQSFTINLAEDGAVSAGNFKVQQFAPDQDWSLVLFGEADYFQQQVFEGPGRSYLTDRYGRFRNGPTLIRDTDLALAVDFVSDLLVAAERTTSLVQSGTGIGGPVDVILVGKHARPQRIRWK